MVIENVCLRPLQGVTEEDQEHANLGYNLMVGIGVLSHWVNKTIHVLEREVVLWSPELTPDQVLGINVMLDRNKSENLTINVRIAAVV